MERQIDRISSGVPGFDALLEGGIPKGSVIILAGHAGVGKTTFCAQFLGRGCNLGQKSLYVTFTEIKTKLFRNMKQFGFLLADLEEKGLLRTEFIQLNGQNNVGITIDQIVKVMEEFQPKRLVIDSATSLALAVPGGRPDTTSMLQNLFAKLGSFEECTTVLVAEMSSGTDQFGSGIEEFISDGVGLVRIRNRGKARVMSLEIRKMRGTAHSSKSVLFEVTDRGIEIDPEIELTS